jgi:hypothetical protein
MIKTHEISWNSCKLGIHQIQYVFWNFGHEFGFDSIGVGFGFWNEARKITLEQINPWDGLLKCVTATPY